MTISRQVYFAIAILLSCLWLGLWLYGQPPLRFATLDALGLADDLRSSEDSFYAQRVQPVLDDYCVSCHGAEKAKGDLRLDAYRYVLFGGDEGAALSRGDPASSLLLERLRLGPEDIRVMPPLGRPRPTSKEMQVLSLWVANGASGTAGPESVPGAPEKVEEVVFPDPDWDAVAARRLPYEKLFHGLANRYPSSVSYIAADSEYVELNGITLGQLFDDEVLAQFESLFPVVRRIEASDTGLTNKSLDSLLRMNELRILRVAGTALDAESLRGALELPALEMLVVDKDQVGEDLRQRAEQMNLRLYIRQ